MKDIDSLTVVDLTGNEVQFIVGENEIEWLRLDNEHKIAQYKQKYLDSIITVNLNMVAKWIYL